MEALALALLTAAGTVTIVAAWKQGFVGPLFLWNFSHLVGLCVPFVLLTMGVDLSDAGDGLLARADVPQITSMFIYGVSGLLISNLVCAGAEVIRPARRVFLGSRRPISASHSPMLDLPLLAALWIASIALGLFLLVSAFGSLGSAVGLLVSKVYEPLAGQTYVLLPFAFAQLIAIIVGVEAAASPRSVGRLLLAACLIFVTAAIMLFVGSRAKSAQTIVIPALVFLLRRSGTTRILLGAGAAALILAISWLGLELRTSGGDLGASGNFTWIDALVSFSTSYAILDQLVVVKWYIDQMGIEAARMLQDYLSIFVPKAVWLDKPLPLQLELRWFLFHDTLGGITPGYFGEFLFYFGYLGAIIGGVFAGVVLSWLSRNVRHAMASQQPSVLIAILVFIFCLQVPRDSLYVASFSMIFSGVCYLLIQRLRLLATALVVGEQSHLVSDRVT